MYPWSQESVWLGFLGFDMMVPPIWKPPDRSRTMGLVQSRRGDDGPAALTHHCGVATSGSITAVAASRSAVNRIVKERASPSPCIMVIPLVARAGRRQFLVTKVYNKRRQRRRREELPISRRARCTGGLFKYNTSGQAGKGPVCWADNYCAQNIAAGLVVSRLITATVRMQVDVVVLRGSFNSRHLTGWVNQR